MVKPRKRKATKRAVAKAPVAPSPGVAPAASVEASSVETSAPADRVMLGSAECRMKRLSTEVVLGLLSDESLRRVGAEQKSASSEPLRKQMLATDGHATPVFFEDGDPPTLLHGYAELAAAVDIGAASVSVLLIPAGGASEAQAHIVEMVRRYATKQSPSDDDELFYRIHAEE